MGFLTAELVILSCAQHSMCPKVRLLQEKQQQQKNSRVNIASQTNNAGTLWANQMCHALKLITVGPVLLWPFIVWKFDL